MPVNPVREGLQSVIPQLSVHEVQKTIDFLVKVFDAKLDFPPMKSPDGAIMHAQLHIGDTVVFLGKPMMESQVTSSTFYMYTPDVDSLYKKAIQAGAPSVMEPKNMFYGDRCGAIKDPGGNTWTIASHMEDVSQDKMKKRMNSIFK